MRLNSKVTFRGREYEYIENVTAGLLLSDLKEDIKVLVPYSLQHQVKKI